MELIWDVRLGFPPATHTFVLIYKEKKNIFCPYSFKAPLFTHTHRQSCIAILRELAVSTHAQNLRKRERQELRKGKKRGKGKKRR